MAAQTVDKAIKRRPKAAGPFDLGDNLSAIEEEMVCHSARNRIDPQDEKRSHIVHGNAHDPFRKAVSGRNSVTYARMTRQKTSKEEVKALFDGVDDNQMKKMK